MSIMCFLKELLEKKQILLIGFVIGFICFAVVGYMGRTDVNNGIVYCSESEILVGEAEKTEVEGTKPVYQKKNAEIASADVIFDSVVDDLAKADMIMTVEELKSALVVYSLDDVVTITVKGNDESTVKQICSIYTVYAEQQLKHFFEDETVSVLNNASEPFTAVVSTVDDTQAPTETITIVKPAVKTDITTGYTISQMVKFGILGGILGLLIVVFCFSVKVLLKGRN